MAVIHPGGSQYAERPDFDAITDYTGTLLDLRKGKVRQGAGQYATACPGVLPWAQLILHTDILAQTGAEMITPDVGARGRWTPNAANTLFKPINNAIVLASKCGSLASPIETLTGVTSGTFNTKVIAPANLFAAQDQLWFRAQFRKVGAGGSGTITSAFGTAFNNTDGAIWGVAVGAGTNRDVRMFTDSYVISQNVMTRAGVSGINADTSAQASDTSTNFDFTSAMAWSFSINSANTGDSYNLIAYSLVLVRL